MLLPDRGENSIFCSRDNRSPTASLKVSILFVSSSRPILSWTVEVSLMHFGRKSDALVSSVRGGWVWVFSSYTVSYVFERLSEKGEWA
jgi:hypothetical protein